MKAFHKSNKNMLKENIFRFLSIVIIIMLGVAFFVGMNAISPLMRASANDYLNDNNVSDFELVSNLGYTIDDLEKFEDENYIESVQGGYLFDVLTKYNDKDVAVRLISDNKEKELNKTDVIEGRRISSDNECLIDSRLQLETGLGVGDYIEVFRMDDIVLSDYISEQKFQIVGITRTPQFLSKIYGNTELLTGELYGYVIVSDKTFKSDYYSALYIKADRENGVDFFSSGYEKYLSEIKNRIEDKHNEIIESKKKLIPVDIQVMGDIVPFCDNDGFKSFKNDLDKMKIMGRIFPVMFFVVAALVTITTISRMIEEDRINIGTLKALGYRKHQIIRRYLGYSFFSTLLGLVLGILIGFSLIVKILFLAYGSLYDIPDIPFTIVWKWVAIVSLICFGVTILVSLIITLRVLKEKTAQLMRPKAAPEGKIILLERIDFLWNRFSFLLKICFRNIFRYKKRLFMTIIGISGCTALIYAGLGLQASITTIGKKEFFDVRKFSMEIYFKEDLEYSDAEKIADDIAAITHVKETAPAVQRSLTVCHDDISKEIFYVSIDSEDIDKYIGIKNRKTGKDNLFNDEGILLTEKIAEELSVSPGDTVTIRINKIDAETKVIGISENYLYNYAYFTPKLYEELFGENIVYNSILANTDDLTEKEYQELASEIKDNSQISTVIIEANNNETFQTSLQSLMAIVILFIVCAAILSFTVLINLSNINIEERKRELATFKVLGFRKKELQTYVFRENIFLTIIGIIFGLILGIGILGLIIKSAEVETIFLPKGINYPYLGLASLITFVFTLITNLLMRKKIRSINMIDSLKSIE